MSYLQNALGSGLETLLWLYLVAAVLRFLMQFLGVDFRNPLAQVVVAATQPPLRALRRFIPPMRDIDTAGLVLVWAVGFAKMTVQLWRADQSYGVIGALVLGLADCLNVVVWTLLIALVVRVILSWVAPHWRHPAVGVAEGLSEPLMAPFRRLLPSFGGLDLSPILVFLALRLVQQLLIAPLWDLGRGLL